MEREEVTEKNVVNLNGSYKFGLPIATIGVLVTLFTFLAFYCSWSYAKGFYGEMGMPAYVISFYSGFQIFPIRGIGTVMLITLLIVMGFLVSYFIKIITKRTVELPLVVICSFVIMSQLKTAYYVSQKHMFFASLVGCVALGVNLSARYELSFKFFFGISLFMAILMTTGEFNVSQGRDVASNILMEGYDVEDTRLIKNDAVPFVNFVSRKHLLFNSAPILRGGSYLYSSEGGARFRLI